LLGWLNLSLDRNGSIIAVHHKPLMNFFSPYQAGALQPSGSLPMDDFIINHLRGYF
jgi:hypothetical protein